MGGLDSDTASATPRSLASDPDAPRSHSPRDSPRVAALAVAAITAAALCDRAPGLAPASLNFDDLYVLLPAQRASLAELYHLSAPAPLGFFALLGAIAACVDPLATWAFQLPAYLGGAAAIALVGATAFKATRCPGTAAFAAALLASSPMAGVVSLRIKHYALEPCLAAALCFLFVCQLDRERADARPRPWPLFALALLALPLSFAGAAVGGSLLAAWGLHALARDRAAALPRIAPWAAAYLLAAGAWYLAIVRNQGNTALVDYYLAYFFPLADPGQWPAFLTGPLASYLTRAVPAPLPWLAALVPLGLLTLARARRGLLLGALAIYAMALTLSALGRYPLGHGRLDSYSLPLTALVCAAAIAPIARRKPAFPWLALALVCGGWLAADPPRYAESRDRAWTEAAVRRAGDDARIVAFQWDGLALAYYTGRPTRFVRFEPAQTNYYNRVDGVALVLEHAAGAYVHTDPRALDAAVEALDLAGARRLVVGASSVPPGVVPGLLRRLRRRGFRVVRAEQIQHAPLVTLERR